MLQRETLRRCLAVEVDDFFTEGIITDEVVSLLYAPFYDPIFRFDAHVDNTLYSAACTLEGLDSEEVITSVMELIY